MVVLQASLAFRENLGIFVSTLVGGGGGGLTNEKGWWFN
jgi:hypothetical protein